MIRTEVGEGSGQKKGIKWKVEKRGNLPRGEGLSLAVLTQAKGKKNQSFVMALSRNASRGQEDAEKRHNDHKKKKTVEVLLLERKEKK